MLLYKDHTAVPDSCPHFNLVKLIDNDYIYFDVSEFRFSELSGNLLLRVVEFNTNFHPLQVYKKIVDVGIGIREVKRIVKGFLPRKQSSFCMFLYNFRQRSLLKYLKDRDNVRYLAECTDIVIGISHGGVPSSFLQVVQVHDPEEGAERPLFIEVTDEDTCNDVIDEIAEKTNSDEDVGSWKLVGS